MWHSHVAPALTHPPSLTEGGLRKGDTACAAPARTGQWPARCATAPGLASSLTEGGLRRGEPLARPPRGQDQRPARDATAPGLASSLTEGGLRRGETARAAPARTGPTARPRRDRPWLGLLPHGGRIEEGGLLRASARCSEVPWGLPSGLGRGVATVSGSGSCPAARSCAWR